MSNAHLNNDEVSGSDPIIEEKLLILQQFFLRLSELFEERRKSDHGSVFLTQKRCTIWHFSESTTCIYSDSIIVGFGETLDSDTEPSSSEQFKDLHPSKPLPIIIRATNGKSKDKKASKVKLSTIVEADALEGFFIKYAEICKLGMSGLKKRDRSKGKKKMKAKKKKGGAAGELEEPKKP